MKIAFLNPFGKNFAEQECASRLTIAAERLSYEAKEFQYSYEIESYEPDFILAISHQTPKLTRYPIYGLLNAPMEYFQTSRFYRNVLSYDGFFAASEIVKDGVQGLCMAAGKLNMEVGYVALTCPVVEFEDSIDFKNATIAYLGTNWDGKRLGDMQDIIAKTNYAKFYGPEKSWDYLKKEHYGGRIPFDGHSTHKVYRKHGVGLCVYAAGFVENELPSNRIFEITASGAYCISAQNKFSERIFGDTVFHFDQSLPSKDAARQILEHLEWVRNNADAAKAKAEKAKEIFDQQFSLEKMLGDMVSYHKEALKNRGYVASNTEQKDKVGYIIRIGDRPEAMLSNALDSLKNQSYKHIVPIIVTYKIPGFLENILTQYRKDFSEVIHIESISECSSTTLWAGLNYVKNRGDIKYVGILDDNDTLFSNHVQSLLNCFKYNENNRNAGNVAFCYSGSIQKNLDGFKLKELWQDEKVLNDGTESSRIHHFYLPHQFSLHKAGEGIPINAPLVKVKNLDQAILNDPQLNSGEGLHLFTMLKRKGKMVFSCELTAVSSMHGKPPLNNDALTAKNGVATIHPNNVRKLWRLLKLQKSWGLLSFKELRKMMKYILTKLRRG